MHEIKSKTLADWLTKKTNAIETEIKSIYPLSGGASMYTWEIVASFNGGFLDGISKLILRSQSDAPLIQSIGVINEFQLLQFLKSQKLKVPEPVLLDERGRITGNPAFIMRRIIGSSKSIGVPNTLTYLDRKKLTRDIGIQLGRLHQIDIQPGQMALSEQMRNQDVTSFFYKQLDLLPYSLPVIEWALRWLEKFQPLKQRLSLCHGDFRNGNLLVHNKRLKGIIDWEFAHIGNPLEDIGWFCARCWRFGNDKEEAGGIGQLSDFIDGYETANPGKVNWIELSYWKIVATVQWALIAHRQGLQDSSNSKRKLELALTGFKGIELEHELLKLIKNYERP
ncbi:MAG: phosphotransferase family protein [Pseudomonadota bacterium]|nr:phosphotransferase family protein [Pseudomonadota bacterium]